MPIEQHGIDLPDVARPAWLAYCEMLNSKDAHFGYLGELHRKYEQGGRRTLAESAYLEQLLATHDRCVQNFARTMRELAGSDPDAHGTLVGAIAALNRSLGGEGAAN